MNFADFNQAAKFSIAKMYKITRYIIIYILCGGCSDCPSHHMHIVWGCSDCPSHHVGGCSDCPSHHVWGVF